MKIEEMSPMTPNSDKSPINPFWHDAYNMGEYLGTNVAVMFSNHSEKHCPYLIIVNRITGERKRITFEDNE